MSVRSTLSHVFLLLLLVVSASLAAATNGSIKGTIKDSQTKEPLPFANVTIKGTSLGTASDISGVYTIQNVPPGTYRLRVGFIGYKTKELNVTVAEGKPTQLAINMEPASIEGEVVVVTAQAQGQNQAINEQLASTAIKNVVSAAKIQELPDANAAESVGRLPGVSLMREGGEGSKVVIRGLSPQYNQITIDGVELSSNVSSGNNLVSPEAARADDNGSVLGDRGTDLSMVSSSMLGGIAVIKAITADMDAAVLGGVVNFDMRKAGKSTDESAMPKFELISQGGYNGLKETTKDYKFVGSAEKRFFENSFGVFAQGSVEKRNLSANELAAGYTLIDKDKGDLGKPELWNLALTDVARQRERYGATVVMDYKHETGDIGFMNFLSRSDTRSTYSRQSAQITMPYEQLLYDLTDKRTKLTVMSNLLSIKQQTPIFDIALKLSHSFSKSDSPEDITFTFAQKEAGFTGISDYLRTLAPKELATYIRPNSATAFLYRISNAKSLSEERSYNGSLDLTSELTISDLLTTKIKFGGAYQYRKRDYNYDQSDGSTYWDGGNMIVDEFRKVYPDLVLNNDGLSLANFVNTDYDYGTFLSGDYTLAYPLNVDLMSSLFPIAHMLRGNTKGGAYRENKLGSVINDYYGHEVKSAFYIMPTINYGEEISFVPGVRYQNLATAYTAMQGTQTSSGFQGGMVETEKSHGYFLPLIHLNFKPLNWLQVHFAYTSTLNYPDYSSITPRFYIGTNFISYNNIDLKPARSQNLDAVLSIYTNEIGLLSVNAFKKTIKDLIFYEHTFLSDSTKFPGIKRDYKTVYDFSTYINSPFDVKVTGIEMDWQTHFWYLPGILSGVVFNINYTHIFSEAGYPKSVKNVEYSEDGSAVITVVDTLYTTRLLNQPNDILNTAIGYDYMGFSFRVSMLYTDNIFKRPDFWMQNRVNSDKYVRWDLSVKQELPVPGLMVYFNLNNITGRDDVDLNQRTGYEANRQRYGMSADAGLRFRF